MFVVETAFATDQRTQRMTNDEVEAVRHAIDVSLRLPGCTVTILRDGLLYLAVQQGDESSRGHPLAPDLIAFLRSRTPSV
jgi:hypothetical protein